MPLLNAHDKKLIQSAQDIINKRYRPGWHAIGCAMRTVTGTVHVSVNVDCNVGRIAVCAEAVAIGRAITDEGCSEIDTIVAVRKTSQDAEPIVVSPCGMCREMIPDYGSQASVIILRKGAPEKVSVIDLLPDKFSRGA